MCSKLTSVTIGKSVTEIGADAFLSCEKLVEVINHSDLNITAGSSEYGNVAYNAIEVHKGSTKIVSQYGYLFYPYEGKNYLFMYTGNDTELILPENYNGEEYQIYPYSFYFRDSITCVTVPSSVTEIGDKAFYGCMSLTSIIVDPENTAYCSIDGNLYTKDGKTLVQYAVGKTDTHFDVPDFVADIGNGAFARCQSLTGVTIPESVTTIGDYAFDFCRSLTSVTIPDSVTVIGDKAFSDCHSLTSVTIGNSVTLIGYRAFINCSRLTSIYYMGTAAEWGNINKGASWNAQIKATHVQCSDGQVAI
jgi:hypothetical protein